MYLKVLIVSFVLLLLGATVGFLAFPMLLQQLVKRQINLKPGSDTRKIWEKMPFPMTFKVFVFNVTNAMEIENGGKPQLQQVGPFVFDEWKDKYNIEDNEAEDAVSFNMRNTYKLRPDLGLSGDQLITMPHALLQFMSIATQRLQPEALADVALGLELILSPESAFITGTFMELFFSGIDVDCDQQHAAALAICESFHAGQVPGAVAHNETHYKFSLMGAGNHSNAGRYTVSRGIVQSAKLGEVLRYNGEQQLQVWPELVTNSSNSNSSCNRLRGTDGTIFAPFMQLPQQGLWSYSAQLCRSLSPQLMGRSSYANLPAYRYELDFGDVSVDAAQQCYCHDYPTDCPAAGTMDLLRCRSAPLVASLPHFHKAQAELRNAVEGLLPSAEQHSTVLIFERLSGNLLAVHNRLQFSLSVQPVAAVPVMSNLSALVMPLFWVEESMQLDELFTTALQKKIFGPLKTNNVIRWMTIIIGCVGCGMGALLLQLRRNDQKRVAPAGETAQSDDTEDWRA